MRLRHSHDWDVSVAQARAIQESLRPLLVTHDAFDVVHHVAGVDVGFDRVRGLTRAAVALLRLDDLELAEQVVVTQPTRFPYVPGYLSFREVPAIVEALTRLRHGPDLVLCDGQGYAHPRRFGLACHLGVLTDLPCIGVAKKRLIGTHDAVPDRRGAWVTLEHRPVAEDSPETIGAVLRTRVGVKPIFVSIGHRVALPSAIDYVMRCTRRYRLPETTRRADRLASGN